MKKKVFLIFLFCVFFLPVCRAEDEVSMYISSLREKIYSVINSRQFHNKIYPHEQFKAVVDMVIWHDGGIFMVEMAESSGDRELDEELKNLIKSLAPYPVLPREAMPSFKIRVPLEFALSGAGDTGRAPQERELKGSEKEVVLEAKEKSAAVNPPAAGECPAGDKKIISVAGEARRLYKEALEKSDPAKVAQEQLDLARLKISEARRNLFPKMELQYSIAEGETITDPYKSKSYALQLRQNLFDRGKTRKALSKEKLNLEVAENEYDKTVQELKFEVIRSYLNVLGKQEELAEVESFRKEISENYLLAKDIYEAGAISKVEFVEVEAEYKRAVNMISQIDNELQLAKEKLRASMNLAPDQEITFEKKDLPMLGDMEIDINQCVNLALVNKPDVRLWEISLKAAEYAKDIALSESSPRLDLVTSYGASGEAYAAQSLDLADEWKMMGVLTWLFGGSSLEVSAAEDKVSSKAITDVSQKTASTTYSAKLAVQDKLQYYVQKKEAEIAYAQNLSNLSKNKQEVVFDTRKSFLECRQAFDEYQVALFEDRFSRVNLDLKKESFKIGRVNLPDVVKSRADYIRKRLSLVRAKTSYYISLASLDKASGFGLGLF